MTNLVFTDGEAAVWSNNADALRAALDGGWDLPRARLHAGHTEDLTLILRVVASNWVDGWRIWSHKRPDFSRNPIVIESVISHAQADILAEIINQNNGALPWDRSPDDLAPVHLLFQSVASRLGLLIEETQIARTVALLKEAGCDTAQPFPGEYTMDGLNPPGHTLWTWLLLCGKWQLAKDMSVGDSGFDAPKAIQAMDRWFEKSWMPSWTNGSDSIFDGGHARQTWLQWMSADRFSRWGELSNYLLNIELHEAINRLPVDYQIIAWSWWLTPHSSDPQSFWCSLHDLVCSVLPAPVIDAVLNAMRLHTPEKTWNQAWTNQDTYGMSARNIWEERLAREIPRN